MKNVVKVIISSALLTGTLLITSCDINDSISIRYEPKETTAASDTSSGNSFSDNSGNSSTTKPPGNSSGDNASSENSGNVIRLGDSNFYPIATDNGDIARLGVGVFDLKPNTKYKFQLSLLQSDPASLFHYMSDSNGRYIYYSLDYDSNPGDFNPIRMQFVEEDWYAEFELTTSESASAFLSFYIFEMDYTTHEAVVAEKEKVIPNIWSFIITEIS